MIWILLVLIHNNTNNLKTGEFYQQKKDLSACKQKGLFMNYV